MIDKFKGLRIYSDDFRSFGYCSRGIRQGFSDYDLSYADFLSDGIDAFELLCACESNALVLLVVEAKYGQ